KPFNPYAGLRPDNTPTGEPASPVYVAEPPRRSLLADIFFGVGIVILGYITSKLQPKPKSQP
ncbi:MAG TPA: hypothetical protein VHL11_14590, partial [Phototrophicaceae bacterium]|nr:hypothetical protein [Phototrophicaceae bacterium]